MEYRPLGKTGLRVSQIALGTVALGMDYGIDATHGLACPTKSEAVRILEEAADSGINLFDTAPSYQESERRLGIALGHRTDCIIATKVTVPSNQPPISGDQLKRSVLTSIESSLRFLRRQTLDIVQIHNATIEVIETGEVMETLKVAQDQGKIRFIGASVYTEEEALAVIQTTTVDLLQVAYSILDQRMMKRVFPAAQHAGVGVLVRSAFLKGALTRKVQQFPTALTQLRMASEKAMATLSCSWDLLPEIALRFCLSAPQVDTVLVGARTTSEVLQAVEASKAGSLPAVTTALANVLSLEDECWWNPACWPAA